MNYAAKNPGELRYSGVPDFSNIQADAVYRFILQGRLLESRRPMVNIPEKVAVTGQGAALALQ
jgi:hypothetical protein